MWCKCSQTTITIALSLSLSLLLCYAFGSGGESLPGHVWTVTAPPTNSPVVLHLPHHPCHFQRKAFQELPYLHCSPTVQVLTRRAPRVPQGITVRSGQVCNMRGVWAASRAHYLLVQTRRHIGKRGTNWCGRQRKLSALPCTRAIRT